LFLHPKPEKGISRKDAKKERWWLQSAEQRILRPPNDGFALSVGPPFSEFSLRLCVFASLREIFSAVRD